MTAKKDFNSILEPKSILLPSTNGTLHKPSTHTNTFRVCFELPNNEIVLPTDTIYSKCESSKRKHRVYSVNNKPPVRLYYCTRNGLPTTYIIPPLPSPPKHAGYSNFMKIMQDLHTMIQFTHHTCRRSLLPDRRSTTQATLFTITL